jgi:hypothetical protein
MVIRRAGTNSDMLGAVQSMWRIGWVVLVVGGREVEGWCWLETALEGVNMTRAGTRSSTRVKLVPGGSRAFQHGHCSVNEVLLSVWIRLDGIGNTLPARRYPAFQLRQVSLRMRLTF